MISVSLALSQTPVCTSRPDHGYRASASHSVPVYAKAIIGTHCVYPPINGQDELTWEDGYTQRLFNLWEKISARKKRYRMAQCDKKTKSVENEGN